MKSAALGDTIWPTRWRGTLTSFPVRVHTGPNPQALGDTPIFTCIFVNDNKLTVNSYLNKVVESRSPAQVGGHTQYPKEDQVRSGYFKPLTTELIFAEIKLLEVGEGTQLLGDRTCRSIASNLSPLLTERILSTQRSHFNRFAP